MSGPPGLDQLVRFKDAVGRRMGLHFDDTKLEFLRGVLERRLEATREDADRYLGRLAGPIVRDELRALAEELTVGETYFFRDADQFRALCEEVLPALLRGRERTRTLRILSAGCASGEEPYSIAMALGSRLADPAAWTIDLRGVDVNPRQLDRARRGVYSAWSLRDTPASVRTTWFRGDPREIEVVEAVRNMVRFEERNLADPDPGFWAEAAWDLVFCRNVMMYFGPAEAQGLVDRLTRTVAPGGYLFLGHVETLRGLTQGFTLCHTHGTFYYRKREEWSSPPPDPRVPPPAAGVRAETAPAPALATWVHETGSWVEAIQRASERIRALTDPLPSPTRIGPLVPAVAPAPAPRPGEAALDLGPALDLLRKERFDEALALVDGLPPEAGRDPEVLLLRSVLLSHGGRLDQAADSCHGLLAIDDLNAGAHYVLALCREGRGDAAGAIDHDQRAAYLDPCFAMPRLHLGLLARRAGDRETARRELGVAIGLLAREEPSRILLFGGGFGREALLALARAELAAVGGP